jgi:AbiV family abortive infection protein
VRDFVADAQTLLSRGHGWHAIVLAIFAFEELGKYAELRRIKDSVKSGQDKVNVKDALFRSHDYKQTIARELIPKDAMILLPASFDDASFDSEAFQTDDVTPSDTLRVQCVFVDWKDDDWCYGTPHDTERLKEFLNAVINALNKLGG